MARGGNLISQLLNIPIPRFSAFCFFYFFFTFFFPIFFSTFYNVFCAIIYSEPQNLHFSLVLLNSVQTQKNLVKITAVLVKITLTKTGKKGGFKIQKSKNAILVLNQSLISAILPIVRFPGDQKTALTREFLHMLSVID